MLVKGVYDALPMCSGLSLIVNCEHMDHVWYGKRGRMHCVAMDESIPSFWRGTTLLLFHLPDSLYPPLID